MHNTGVYTSNCVLLVQITTRPEKRRYPWCILFHVGQLFATHSYPCTLGDIVGAYASLDLRHLERRPTSSRDEKKDTYRCIEIAVFNFVWKKSFDFSCTKWNEVLYYTVIPYGVGKRGPALKETKIPWLFLKKHVVDSSLRKIVFTFALKKVDL